MLMPHEQFCTDSQTYYFTSTMIIFQVKNHGAELKNKNLIVPLLKLPPPMLMNNDQSLADTRHNYHIQVKTHLGLLNKQTNPLWPF